MDEILDKLFDDYVAMAIKSEGIKELEADAENNRKRLSKNLKKSNKRILLRFEDAKDAIKELNNIEFFTAGFKIGLKIGYEVNAE